MTAATYAFMLLQVQASEMAALAVQQLADTVAVLPEQAKAVATNIQQVYTHSSLTCLDDDEAFWI